jgi:hypothetical protein
LLHRLLDAPVRLLAIPILVSAGGVGRLGLDPVVPHERPVVLRELFSMAILVHSQTHAVIAMPLRRRSQGPQGVLQALAETGEALRKAHRDVFPVRVGQHEVVQQMVEALTLNADAHILHVREVGGAQPPGLVHLAEVHLLGRTFQRTPAPHPPLQGPQHRVDILTRITLLQPLQ